MTAPRRPLTEHRFQVDLGGVVDLLSHHLYASPRVYLRELLQNAVDAVTARRDADPGAPAGRVLLAGTGDGTLEVHDNGIGLTEPEVHAFLASVGRTSKRDDLGFARQDYLGQFGIGLLSCFMVADSIEVVTRSARGGAAVRWIGYATGRYAIDDRAERAEAGTTVRLRPRPGTEHWLAPDQVDRLAREYGHLLDLDVRLVGPGGSPVRVTQARAPWEAAYPDPAGRRAALLAYGTELLGAAPLDVIDLRNAEADLAGVAFVLPGPGGAGTGSGHRVYLKRMLLGTEDNLLPEWAFFVRAVVNTGGLRPTASREALFEDDLLATVRHDLGEQIRTWLLDLSATDPDRLATFLRVHHLGVKAMAVRDDEMLRLVDAWLPMETTRGPMPLRQFRRGVSVIRYTATVDEFRALAPIAAAAGIALVNAGYAHDAEILSRLPRIEHGLSVRALDPGELAARFEPLPPAQEAELAGFLECARAALSELGCVPRLRSFDPVGVPALYLAGDEARERRRVRGAMDVSDELWSDVLSAFADVRVDRRPELVLNWRHPLVRLIAGYPPGELLRHAVRALYGQSLLAGHHPLRAADSAALNRAFLALLERAFRPPDAGTANPQTGTANPETTPGEPGRGADASEARRIDE